MEYKILEAAEIPLMEKLMTDNPEGIEGFRQFSYEYLKKFIDSPSAFGFIAKENNSIIGLCYGDTLQRPDKALSIFYIHSLGILENYRNKGIGSKLFEFVKNYAFEKLNCYECLLITEKDNRPAHKVYEKSDGKIYEDQIVYEIKKERV